MKTIAAGVLAGLVAATSLVAAPDPASAQRWTRADRDRYIERWCDDRPRTEGCYEWRRDRGRWDDRRYRDWYRRHHDDDRDEAGIAALFGLGVGALLGGTVAGPLAEPRGRDVTEHVRRCQERYRSYDPRTNTYLGYDGYRHPCRL